MHSSTDANRNPRGTLGTGSRRVKLNSFEVVFRRVRSALAWRTGILHQAKLLSKYFLGLLFLAIKHRCSAPASAAVRCRLKPACRCSRVLCLVVVQAISPAAQFSRRVVASRGTQMPTLSLLCKAELLQNGRTNPQLPANSRR